MTKGKKHIKNTSVFQKFQLEALDFHTSNLHNNNLESLDDNIQKFDLGSQGVWLHKSLLWKH